MNQFVKSDYVPSFQDILYISAWNHKSKRTNDRKNETIFEGPGIDFSEKIPLDILAMFCSDLSLNSIHKLSLANKTLFPSKATL